MNWTGFWTIFFIATFKFFFSTVPGPSLGMTFFETALAAFSGGSVSALLCYFASDGLLLWWNKRKHQKDQAIIAAGGTPKVKRKFNRTNRLIVKLKMKFGQVGICFYAPFFFSVPIGSIVAAKFYGKRWQTFPLILLGLAFNASLTSIFVYFVFK